MLFPKLSRWSGILLILAAVLLFISWAIGPSWAAARTGLGPSWAISHTGLLIAGLLLLFALIGLYARQIDEMGVVGLIGFVLAFIATAVFTGFMAYEAFLLPALAAEAPEILGGSSPLVDAPTIAVFVLYSLSQSLGVVLLGVATMRAGILSRWAALLAVIGIFPAAFAPLLPAPIDWIGRVLLCVGLAWLGYSLWASVREAD